MNLQDFRNHLEQQKGKASQIKADLEKATVKYEEIKEEISISEKSQIIIQVVAKATQSELEYRITEPVSLMEAAVYSDPYKMIANFEITGRGNTECHLGFERRKSITNPLGASGGGPIDIASWGLRIGGLSLQQPKSRPLIITDEPFKWIDKEKIQGSETTTMHLVGQMLKDISKPLPDGLGLQIIMMTHIKELISCADRVFEVSIKDRVSSIKTRENN